jgi:hypothetical protein
LERWREHTPLLAAGCASATLIQRFFFVLLLIPVNELIFKTIIRKWFEPKFHTSSFKKIEVKAMNCSELKDGQILFCKGCGFELKVVNDAEPIAALQAVQATWTAAENR